MSATRAWLAALLAAPLLCGATSTSIACACCSEEGQYVAEENGKASDVQTAEMAHLKFGPTVALYVGAGDKDDVKGITTPAYQYSLAATFESDTDWRFSFRDEEGKTGTLWVPIKAAKVSIQKLDVHDGTKSAGGGPSLYKEWKFRGRVRGDGIFKAGVNASAEATLILQGRGNNCDAASDFTHWRLEVAGAKAKFAFVGELTSDDQAGDLRADPTE